MFDVPLLHRETLFKIDLVVMCFTTGRKSHSSRIFRDIQALRLTSDAPCVSQALLIDFAAMLLASSVVSEPGIDGTQRNARWQGTVATLE